MEGRFPKRMLSRAVVAKHPYLVWNAFIDLLGNTQYEDLSPVQQAAQLVLRYDGEIQNGGHLQYFENGRLFRASETVEALTALGATAQSAILKRAIAGWKSRSRTRIETVEEYVAEALTGEFDDLDMEYYDCVPDTHAYMQKYLSSHQNEFVVIADYVLPP